MYLLFLRLFSPTGYYRQLSRVPVLYSRSLLSIKESSIHILISNSPFIPLSPFTVGNYNYCFDGGKCLGTFWFRVSACESGVARESKHGKDSFEMMLHVEKDLAMQKAGRKTL